ncbi:hypothetical protein [Terrabacter sp. NPDC080008]|uniref:hypothetical protein n=1 Tax=Terrabacter sp. NPDC080008 TaxID=3155176 RepID=UPI003450C58D
MAESWEVVLERLGSELAALERELAQQAPPSESTVAAAQLATWVPPRGLGPLPDHLLGQARALAEAQARVAAQLDALRMSVVHHLTALRTSAPSPQQAPVFVDVRG